MYRVRIGCQLHYVAATATPSVFILQPPPARGRCWTGRSCPWWGRRWAPSTRTPSATAASGSRWRPARTSCASTPARWSRARPTRSAPPPARCRCRSCPRRCCATPCRAATPRPTSCSASPGRRFARFPAGWERAHAICEWVHATSSTAAARAAPTGRRPTCWPAGTASAAIAPTPVIALCRAFNMPARYAVSYLPDIDVPDDGLPMDFHAYAEVWLEGGWQVFDPAPPRTAQGPGLHRQRPRRRRRRVRDALRGCFAHPVRGVGRPGRRAWRQAGPAPAERALGGCVGGTRRRAPQRCFLSTAPKAANMIRRTPPPTSPR